MTDFVTPTEQPSGVNLTTLERMLSVGGPAMRPALIEQVLADLYRLRTALASDRVPAIRHALHELKGIASTIGADLLADSAAHLDMSLEHAAPGACSDQFDGLRRRIDDLVALLAARNRRVPTA